MRKFFQIALVSALVAMAGGGIVAVVKSYKFNQQQICDDKIFPKADQAAACKS